jgi:hypothetical protein
MILQSRLVAYPNCVVVGGSQSTADEADSDADYNNDDDEVKWRITGTLIALGASDTAAWLARPPFASNGTAVPAGTGNGNGTKTLASNTGTAVLLASTGPNLLPSDSSSNSGTTALPTGSDPTVPPSNTGAGVLPAGTGGTRVLQAGTAAPAGSDRVPARTIVSTVTCRDVSCGSFASLEAASEAAARVFGTDAVTKGQVFRPCFVDPTGVTVGSETLAAWMAGACEWSPFSSSIFFFFFFFFRSEKQR